MDADDALVETPESADPAPNAAGLFSPDALRAQTVRKSVSVDSFAPHIRDAPRPNRGNTASALEAPRGLNAVMRAPVHLYNGRKRGASVSSSLRDDYDSSNDPDDMRPEFPDGGVKIRAGQLPLPPRTTTLSTASSMSSIMSASTTSSTEDGIYGRPIQPSMSLPPSRNGRARSGSLGVYGSSSTSTKHPFKTRINSLEAHTLDALTILVVGAKDCGKTVVIRKGLKDYGLSEPSNHAFEVGSRDFAETYNLRVGHIKDGVDEYPFHVVEVDVAKRSLEDVAWPENSPKIDGVIMCYDASDAQSFLPVEGLLQRFRTMMVPTLVLACKSDLERRVDPQGAAADFLQLYDNGLVEVTSTTDAGKKKMRQAFEWLIRAVFRGRHTSNSETDHHYRNPASPVLLISPPPWEISRNATPTASSVSSLSTLSQGQTLSRLQSASPLPTIPASRVSSTPNSPTRARSTGDLLSEHEKSRARDWQAEKDTTFPPVISAVRSNPAAPVSSRTPPTSSEAVNDISSKKDTKEKDVASRPWANLDELLDKLLFLAVSGDDPSFITHFLLTYRRFASPRSVLLSMQLRLRQLDKASGDPMFACFAQMRICHLLEQWIRDYPYDFKVRGTPSALSALFKSITSKTYLLHYGSDFLPFHELLPNLVDKDAAWAYKPDYPEDESDYDDDEKSVVPASSTNSAELERQPSLTKSTSSSAKVKHPAKPLPVPTPMRERKGSLPLGKQSMSAQSTNHAMPGDEYRVILKELQKVAMELNATDSEEVAQEITRLEVKLFLDIEPRHWLRFTFVRGRKDPLTDSIARFNDFSNHLADWVVSLILCHDKVKARAKQIEKIVEIAQKLRGLNNYSALRAFVAGINIAAPVGDPTMEQLKAKSPDHAKNLQSWDVLLQQTRSHRAYRLALRNTKGACIPALEVHVSDLIRADEANKDFHSNDRTQIHWGKFNMMGRFIGSTTQCQAQCRAVNDYNFPARESINRMLRTECLMDEEMQKSRAPEAEIDGPSPAEIKKMRKLFLW